MASPSSLPPLGFKQLSVCLVDFLKTPGLLRPASRLEAKDSSNLVDCWTAPVLNWQQVHPGVDQSERSIDFKLKQEEEQLEVDCYFENPQQVDTELDQGPYCGAKNNYFKEEEEKQLLECFDNCSETKEEETIELDLSHKGAAEALSEIHRDDGSSLGVKWVVQNYELSAPLMASMIGQSEEHQEERDCTDAKSQSVPSDSTISPERHGPEAEQRSEDKNKGKKIEQGARPHRCEHCGKSFVRRSNIIRHQRLHCSVTKNTPEHTQWDTDRDEKEICEDALRERRHVCRLCNKKFYLLQTLRQHLLTHTGTKPYSCNVCGKQFGREGSLKEHQVVHTGEKAFMCEQCGKTCARRGDLKIHMLSHSEERPYGCSHCPKSFKHQAKLKEHERIHTGERPYPCKFCPKKFRTHMSLAVHQYTHSGDKPFKCVTCSKPFSNRNNLKKHVMIHNGEKPHRCSHCGKDYRLLQHLIFHKRSHSGEKPYKCEKCGKGYSHPSGLRTHLSNHQEEKLPRCSLCGRDFLEPAELMSHICCETAEKPHRCSQCGKCFSQSVNLKKHLLIHTGEKPYSCKICGKQFNDRGNLSKHSRIHSGEKPFMCEHCQRGFRLLQHLTHHRLTHKKND